MPTPAPPSADAPSPQVTPAASSPGGAEAAIRIERVAKAFAGKPAVRPLSLDVPTGSIFGLLGHNGAGKSTLLGMLLGQVYPDAGEIRVLGARMPEDRRRALARVGAIFESPAFFDYLSGRTNLKMLAAYSGPVSRRELDEVIDLVRLHDRIDDPVATYSHGMRQRLGLAQALLPRPDLLILDEPSDGLDPEGIHEMRELILRLHQERELTILFSSHMLSEVEQVCTHLAVMRAGELLFAGPWDAAALAGRFTLEVDDFALVTAKLREAGLIQSATAPDTVTLAPGAAAHDVARAVVASGSRLHALAPERRTLEAFYLELVRRGRPPGAAMQAGALAVSDADASAAVADDEQPPEPATQRERQP